MADSPDKAADPTPSSGLVQVAALLASLAILAAGNGLQGTLLAVRAGLEGMSGSSLGVIMSAYFAGFLGGSVVTPVLVTRVGHIRAFAALASIASALALLHLLYISPSGWAVMRLLYGLCYAGVLVIAESWLSGHSRHHRGRVLGLYNAVVMSTWAGGQLLINAAPPGDYPLFLLVSILLSLSLVPITLSRVARPGVVTASRMSLGQLYQLSPMGLTGTLAAGFAIGGFMGMGPRYAQEAGFDTAGISLFMFTVMIGGLFLQLPLGWISDRVDRRRVILWMAAGTTLFCLALALYPDPALGPLLALAFAFGANAIPVYSVCVAHVHDHVEDEMRVSVAGSLILVYGAGAILGPLVSGLVMDRMGPGGLFAMIGAVLAAQFVFGIYRIRRRPALKPELKEPFTVTPRTTHVAPQLDEHVTKEQWRSPGNTIPDPPARSGTG